MGKTKLFMNCFRKPTSTCATEIWRKHKSGKQPTVDCTLEPIQRTGIKHSVGKVIPQSNLSREGRPSKLGSSTPWYFKLKLMWCGRSSGRSNSNRSRWKRGDQTVITVWINLVQHTKPVVANLLHIMRHLPYNITSDAPILHKIMRVKSLPI